MAANPPIPSPETGATPACASMGAKAMEWSFPGPHSGFLAAVCEAAQHSTDLVAVLGPDWSLLFANPACQGVLDPPGAGDRSGQPTEGGFPAWIEASLFQEIKVQAQSRPGWRGHLTLRLRGGSTETLAGSITPVQDMAAGTPVFLAVFRDLTAESAHARHQRQNQKLETLGLLAGGIAHDFNNILAAILASTEVLDRSLPAGAPARSAVEILRQSGERARALTKQILQFSRNGQDQQVPFDLSRLFKEATRLLRSTLPKSLEIQEDWPLPVWMEGDPNQIHQVFMNLAINGAQAVGLAGGKLHLSLHQVCLADSSGPGVVGMAAGSYAVLSVEDTGCGMDPCVMERIFDPFFTTKIEGDGTGLGLAIAQDIALKHGGRILVSSQTGQGSTFRVFLPAIKAVQPDGSADHPGTPAGSERILLVEDEDLLVALTKRRLQELGYRVTAKTCSKQAFETFLADPGGFDLLLTDMDMPHLTGAELTAMIRKIRPDLPVLLVTGLLPRPGSTWEPPVRFDEILVKPQFPVDLARAIRRILDSRGFEPATNGPGMALFGDGIQIARRSGCILLVDDVRETRMVIRTLLLRNGHSVREAEDGQAAWETFRADPGAIDLILTDLAMPRMDGLTLVGKIRAVNPAIPVLMLSASIESASVETALDLHVTEYLNKPIGSDALLECIEQHLGPTEPRVR